MEHKRYVFSVSLNIEIIEFPDNKTRRLLYVILRFANHLATRVMGREASRQHTDTFGATVAL